MRVLGIRNFRRWLAVIMVAAGLTVATTTFALKAFAGSPVITGVVEDSSGTPLADVTVNVLDPSTDATDGSTTTAVDGSFSVSVNSGTYNVQLIPPSSLGLQSDLATGVSTDSAPLTIILKSATVIQVQGTLADSLGNVYPNQGGAVTFKSPLNSGTALSTDGSGGYSVGLLADQNFTARVFVFTPGNAASLVYNNLPVGTLDHSQTYNLTLPVADLSVTVQDASGSPVTGGKVEWDSSSVSSLPGLPGANAASFGGGVPLDSHGNASSPVPVGVTLVNPRIVLNNGLSVPFTAPTMNGNQSVTVTVPTSIQVQGTLADSLGNVYPNQGGAVTFKSPLNSGTALSTDGSGGYSVGLLADQNFTARVFVFTPGNAASLVYNNLPVGTLDHSQTYNLTLPVADLSVTVQDASGSPVTGGKVEWDSSSVSSLPGLPGANAASFGGGVPLDSHGNASSPVPVGVTLVNPRIVLNNGLSVPFTAPTMNGNQSVTVTVPTSIQVQGTLADSLGNVYPNQGGAVTFKSPLNSGTALSTDGSGGYSVGLLADQNFTARVFVFTPGNAASLVYNNLPVGTLDHSQTYNLTLPVADLSVTVQDASGSPVTGGKVEWDSSSVSSLPGLPGANAASFGGGVPLDSHGNASSPVPVGVTLVNPRIVLNNGLALPFTLSATIANEHVFLILSNGTLIVDQPPNVTGTPDRAPNANGWYNAPVTITWTSVAGAGSPGTPTTPPPVTLSTEGANQKVTSAQSCDPAGNCATGTVTGLNLDVTPPSVSVTGVTSGTTYSTAPTPTCSTTDSLSEVASDATVSVANSGTEYTATCSGAADKAGNQAAPVSVSYQVVPAGSTTASLTDSNGNPISGAAVVFRPASGSATSATTGADGTATVTLTPGSYSVIMYYANGYQAKTISVTAAGPNTVAFATVAVTAQINDPDSADLATASVAHAGNTGTYGPKTPVDGNGQVSFQVLPGTNTFAAYDANGYQTKSVTVTGATTVTFATVTVTARINDPDSADLATASVAHAGNTGTYGPKTPVDGNGQVSFQVLPGTNTFAAYDANGYQTQTVSVSGPVTVTFATVAVTVTVLKNGAPLTTASVAHAGNTGAFGPKTPVDGNGVVVFQVLPGTNTFTAWDGSAYTTQKLTVTAAISTSISVS